MTIQAEGSSPSNRDRFWRHAGVSHAKERKAQGSLIQAAKADSWWQMLMLHGALGEGWHSDLISYEVPTYFGMLCAAFAPLTVAGITMRKSK